MSKDGSPRSSMKKVLNAIIVNFKLTIFDDDAPSEEAYALADSKFLVSGVNRKDLKTFFVGKNSHSVVKKKDCTKYCQINRKIPPPPQQKEKKNSNPHQKEKADPRVQNKKAIPILTLTTLGENMHTRTK
jgi:hypothetical protein